MILKVPHLNNVLGELGAAINLSDPVFLSFDAFVINCMVSKQHIFWFSPIFKISKGSEYLKTCHRHIIILEELIVIFLKIFFDLDQKRKNETGFQK